MQLINRPFKIPYSYIISKNVRIKIFKTIILKILVVVTGVKLGLSP
jgi:hypothetical protein